ncbi:MAG: pyruvate ferredoxin oxidoreductase, partial [Desulfurococcaceae archaeon]
PVVMAIVSRTINTPWNIWPDHSDFVDQRDAGWIMSYAMDSQEAFDLTLQAFKISEHPMVYLPVMVGIEGFIVGHTATPVDLPDEKLVDEWLGERKQPYVIDGSEPIGLGNLALPEDTEDMFYGIQEAMENSKKVIKEVDEEYGKLFGRRYGGLVSCYNCSDAKYIAIAMGAWTGDLIEAALKLRNEGYPVGVLRIRYYRPFPADDIWNYVSNTKGIVVFDRAISFGAWGPLYTDLVAGLTLHSAKLPVIVNVVAGIAGVDVSPEDFNLILKSFIDKIEKGEYTGRNFFTWEKVRR